MRTRRGTQPIGNIVSQSDSVTATAATTATAAASVSGFPPLRKLGGNVATGSVYSGLGYSSHGTCITGILHKV